MDNTTNTTEAPLTRRQAREIERRTGVRQVVVASSGSFRYDTAEIARNEMAALVSVLPTELVERIAAPAPVASIATAAGAERSMSVRAAVPAQIVSMRRRRVAGGFAAAASVTALATAGVAGAASGAVADQSHQASLVSAVQQNAAAKADQGDIVAAAAEAAPAVAPAVAPAPAVEVTAANSVVESFDAASVMSAAEAVPTPTATASNGGSGSTGSSASAASNGGSSSISIPKTGSIQEAVVAAAYAQLGISGMDCTDMVQNALAAAGLTTSRFDGGYDMGVSSFYQFGTVIPASEAQPGDLMIAPGAPHVAIYIGGGQAIHGGWNGDADDTVIAGVNTYSYDYVRIG